MDSNEALRLIRLYIAQMRVEDGPVSGGVDPGFVQHARDLAETVEGLDTWLSQGGFKPLAWENFGGLKSPAPIEEPAPAEPAAPTRHAVVRGQADKIETIRRYLPSNYWADHDGGSVFIHGVDSAGWTLDGYVIPRLASGLYFAEEVT